MKKHRDVRRFSRDALRAKSEELDPGFRRDDELGGFRRDDEGRWRGPTKIKMDSGFRRNDEDWGFRRDDKAAPRRGVPKRAPAPPTKEIYRFIANKRYNPLPARQGALRPRVILRTFRKGLH